MTFKVIYALVRLIPPGKVLTYKNIANVLGLKDIRLVGFALHKNKNPQIIPCHRAVRYDGSLASGYAFGGKNKQRQKLISEKVFFEKKDKVDL